MRPKEITIELTNACNSDCVMCLHSSSKRPIVHMELDLIEKIVNEGLMSKDYPLCICGIGEPLLHPDFIDALSIVSEVPFGMGSNCQELSWEKRYHIMKSKFSDFTLSLDAMTEDTHGCIRRGLNFNTVMSNALSFIEELGKRECFWRMVYIQFIVCSINVHELEPFINFWLDKIKGIPNVKIFIKPMCKWPGIDNPYYPSPAINFRNDFRVLYGPLEKGIKFREGCCLFDNFVQVQSDGAYSPCCMNPGDEYGIGNVNDNTIEELYNSPKMNRLRDLFKEKRYEEIPFCSKCE